MIQNHSGSGLCQQVQFEIDGSFESFFLCHCQFCQKDTGSAHSSNLFSSNAQLIWKNGQENVKTFNLAPTRHTRSFCMSCGSALPYQLAEANLLVVPAGSLDTKISLKPNAHLFCSSKAAWDENLEGLKKFETFPS